jgi:hypothetical protein
MQARSRKASGVEGDEGLRTTHPIIVVNSTMIRQGLRWTRATYARPGVPDLIAAHGSLFATLLAPHQEIKWSAFRATDYHSRSKAFADQLGVSFEFQCNFGGVHRELPFGTWVASIRPQQ